MKQLRKEYGAYELHDALSTKLSKSELARVEETVINYLSNVNANRDDYYHTFNNDTQEYEIRLDPEQELITNIVAAIFKLEDKIDDPTTSIYDRRRMYGIRAKFIAHLRKIGANLLADSLE